MSGKKKSSSTGRHRPKSPNPNGSLNLLTPQPRQTAKAGRGRGSLSASSSPRTPGPKSPSGSTSTSYYNSPPVYDRKIAFPTNEETEEEDKSHLQPPVPVTTALLTPKPDPKKKKQSNGSPITSPTLRSPGPRVSSTSPGSSPIKIPLDIKKKYKCGKKDIMIIFLLLTILVPWYYFIHPIWNTIIIPWLLLSRHPSCPLPDGQPINIPGIPFLHFFSTNPPITGLEENQNEIQILQNRLASQQEIEQQLRQTVHTLETQLTQLGFAQKAQGEQPSSIHLQSNHQDLLNQIQQLQHQLKEKEEVRQNLSNMLAEKEKSLKKLETNFIKLDSKTKQQQQNTNTNTPKKTAKSTKDDHLEQKEQLQDLTSRVQLLEKKLNTATQEKDETHRNLVKTLKEKEELIRQLDENAKVHQLLSHPTTDVPLAVKVEELEATIQSLEAEKRSLEGVIQRHLQEKRARQHEL